MTLLSLTLIVFTSALLAATAFAHRANGRFALWADVGVRWVPLLVILVFPLLWAQTFAELVGLQMKSGRLFALYLGGALAGPLLLLAPRWRALGAAFVASGMAFLTLADVLYWRYFESLMPLAASQSAGLAADVSASILSLVEAKDAAVILLLLPPVALGVLFFSLRRRRKIDGEKWFVRLPLLLLLLFPIRYPLEDVQKWLGTSRSWKVFTWKEPVTDIGVVQAHLRDAGRMMREASLYEEVTDEEIQDIAKNNLAGRPPRSQLEQDPYFGAAKGLNVLILQLEALQAWAVRPTSNGKALAPTLTAIKEHGLWFDNVWDVTGGSPTADCEYAVMTSQYPLAQGAVSFRRPANAFTALPKLLKAQGYSTLSGHANHARMWNRGVIHPAWGIDRSMWKGDFPNRPRYGWGLADHVFVQQAAKAFAKVEEPAFGFFLTLTSHHPYRYLPKSKRTFSPKAYGTQLANYLSSVHYLDGVVLDALKTLQAKGRLQNTMVVLYGDHDARLKFKDFGRKAMREFVGVSEKDAVALSWRKWRTKKIPLGILLPEQSAAVLAARSGHSPTPQNKAETATDIGGAPSGIAQETPPEPFRASSPQTFRVVGSQVDIGPTILHLLGMPIPPSAIGQPLTAATSGFAARGNGSGVDDERVYDPKHSRPCQDHAGNTRPPKDCEPLKRRAKALLSRSWSITLGDLAKRVDAAGATLD